jgi:hypothetical protein
MKVVVPTTFSVNFMPGEFTGLPSSGTAVPFSVSETVVAFCVCQLTVTVPPCSTVLGVTVIDAVGFDGFGLGFGDGPGLGFDVGFPG